MMDGGRSPGYFKLIYIITQIIGLLCILFEIAWLFCFAQGFSWRSNPTVEFNIHPLLMSTGFIYLSANSLLIYRGLRFFKKQYLKGLHIGIHIVALGCVVVALIAVFDSHNFSTPPKVNLYSTHSWLGITTVLLYIIQIAVGCLMYSYPGVIYSVRIKSIHYHIFFGLVIFIFANITAFSGFSGKMLILLGSKYTELSGEVVLVNIIAFMHLIFCVLVVYLIVHVPYQRRPSPEDGVAVNAYPLGIFFTRNC